MHVLNVAVKCIQPEIMRNTVFVLFIVVDEISDYMVEAYSSASLVIALYVMGNIFLCSSNLMK